MGCFYEKVQISWAEKTFGKCTNISPTDSNTCYPVELIDSFSDRSCPPTFFIEPVLFSHAPANYVSQPSPSNRLVSCAFCRQMPLLPTFLPHPPLPRRSANRLRPPLCCSQSPNNTWSEAFSPRPLSELRVGGLAVPRHLWRPSLRHAGVIRGVEYKILALTLHGNPILTTRHLPRPAVLCVVATLAPLRPLIPRVAAALTFPVDASVSDAVLWSYKRDIAQCLAVTLTTAASTLLFGIFAPAYCSLYLIPSLSMSPTFLVGDAILVVKNSHVDVRRGDVVFFSGPGRLLDMIHAYDASTSATKTSSPSLPPLHVGRRDLFVKRVAAVQGDVVSISDGAIFVNGATVSSAAEGSVDCEGQRVPDNFLYVLGDNPPHSLDSRYWGLLDKGLVVGKPVARLWPPARLSRVQ